MLVRALAPLAALGAALCAAGLLALAACGGGRPAAAGATPSPSVTPTVAYAHKGPASVRVNQVGYSALAPKRAYLMATASENGGVFAVKDAGGKSIFTAPIGAATGSWSKLYPNVYVLDFSSLSTPGVYTLNVAGPLPATSPPFRIGDGVTVYAQALANALTFYQTERDGPDFVASALRTAPGHLNDRHAMTYATPKVNADGIFAGDLRPLGVRIDASGGWWDAGDYLKFVHATSYTEALLLAGVRDFPAQMGAGSPSSDFTAEVKFGADWLLRMWNDKTRTLYYQVGIGSGNDTIAGDHDIWRLPQADDTYGGNDPMYRYIRNRPVFRAGPPGAKLSPNLAGRTAAALAEAYQVFRVSDPAFAATCLTAAAHIYELADTHPKKLMTAIPFDYYPEVEWRDDMELGATELYFAAADLARAIASAASSQMPTVLPKVDALDATSYLRRAAHWARAYIDGPNDAADTLNLYDVSAHAHYELCRALAMAGNPGGLEVSRAVLLADLKRQLDKAVAQASRDPFRFGFAWNTWDTTSHGAGLVVMASEYDELTGARPGSAHSYATWADGWLGNILGANAWGTSLIVGDGTVFPHCLQHQVANLAGTLDGRAPVLLGACVEGPNADQDNGTVSGMRLGPKADPFERFNGHSAKWRDAVQNYPNTEPAIDLTAASPLAFARLSAGRY